MAKKAAKKATPAKVKPAATLLDGDKLAGIVQDLQGLAEQEPVRTKQRAAAVAKRVHTLLPPLEGHAAAWEALDPARGVLAGYVEDLENYVEDMLDAEDADEREDAHSDLQSGIEDVLAHLDY